MATNMANLASKILGSEVVVLLESYRQVVIVLLGCGDEEHFCAEDHITVLAVRSGHPV